MATRDYYQILGVNKGANADELKSAYRRLAKQYHPDVFATAEQSKRDEAEAKFKDVQHAYDVLSDPQKRAAFDQYGSEDGPTMSNSGFGGAGGFNPFGGGGGGGFDDILSSIFSGFGGASGGRSSASNARDGEDIEVSLNLTFQEACFGVEKEITFSRVEKCPTCGGTGAKNGTSLKTCTKCGGRGRVTVNQRTMFGTMQTEKVCDMCQGRGKIIVDKCTDCRGAGIMKKQRTVKVKIPAGVDNGQMLTMQNEGNSGSNNGANGNLIIGFRVKAHPLFVRDGVNLNLELPITFLQATLGDRIDIPTLSNPISIDIPEGTQDGTIIRVKNRGVKNLRREAYGDIFVKVVVDIPKNITSKQRKQLLEMQDIIKDARFEKIEKYQRNLKEL